MLVKLFTSPRLPFSPSLFLSGVVALVELSEKALMPESLMLLRPVPVELAIDSPTLSFRHPSAISSYDSLPGLLNTDPLIA